MYRIMKSLLAFCLLAVSVAVAKPAEGDIFDVYNIEYMMTNDEIRSKGMDCVMDRAPCGEYQIFRDIVSNILTTRCGNCTPQQKEQFEKMFKKFRVEHEKDYRDLMQKYVPEALE